MGQRESAGVELGDIRMELEALGQGWGELNGAGRGLGAIRTELGARGQGWTLAEPALTTRGLC